ncbi:uncharacterized protein CLUP02_08857 [Colletotrichum lupini]|uniref:Uncharacterized protein n=1 Tax=Colletotrichum lupini TaxID=145971 RepID=A0A9Q8WHV3_9PEZI|nr:uncharacterized protein CLUP02_08857 [Colletotrichum lupini]UQC83362.1 hypothetical protein CLUP02_08857 [Colletotrichum lupini]
MHRDSRHSRLSLSEPFPSLALLPRMARSATDTSEAIATTWAGAGTHLGRAELYCLTPST